MPQRADFIIIGAMKCATSTLHSQLAQQPGIYISGPGETNFFSNDEIYARGIGWYEGRFKDATSDQHCGECSTHYTKLPTYPDTVGRMSCYLPHVRLIYVMRHPIDRLVSQYIHEWTERVIERPIAQALEQRPELVAYSCYARQLEPFLDTYGPENVLPVFFDRLCSQPQYELKRICRFIGHQGPVFWYPEEPHNKSSERMRKSLLRDAIVQISPMAMLGRSLIPKAVRRRIKQLWMMKERPQLPETQERHLENVFDADLKKLGDWLGSDLSCTSFRDLTARRSLDWIVRKRRWVL